VLEPIQPGPPRAIRNFAGRQRWSDLTFLHWPAPVSRLQLPPGLQPDLWEGQAYIGLVPFLLSYRGLGTFPETNLRTYVIDQKGRRGVWFYSLDADRLAAVAGARLSYGLPYFWARMSVTRSNGSIHYRSTRRAGPQRETDIVIKPGAAIAKPTDFEHFLTARWRLYALRFGRLIQAEVDHPAWPLYEASVAECRQTFLDEGRPLIAHYSPGVDVTASWPGPI